MSAALTFPPTATARLVVDTDVAGYVFDPERHANRRARHDKQAQTLLMPVAARRQLNDLPDDLWTCISIEFYKDAADAVFKALVE